MESKCWLGHFASESAHPAIPLPEARVDLRAFVAQDRLAAETGALKQPHKPHRTAAVTELALTLKRGR